MSNNNEHTPLRGTGGLRGTFFDVSTIDDGEATVISLKPKYSTTRQLKLFSALLAVVTFLVLFITPLAIVHNTNAPKTVLIPIYLVGLLLLACLYFCVVRAFTRYRLVIYNTQQHQQQQQRPWLHEETFGIFSSTITQGATTSDFIQGVSINNQYVGITRADGDNPLVLAVCTASDVPLLLDEIQNVLLQNIVHGQEMTERASFS
eukprot:PhM_4_TR14273/c2_g1_i1/m.4877